MKNVATLKDYSASLNRPLRVATKFPVLTERFLNQHQIPHALIAAEGTLEIAPTIGYADMISDLVSSGQTLQDNRLRPLPDGVIQPSQARVDRQSQSAADASQAAEMACRLLEYIEAHLRAEANLLVIANMRGESPEAIAKKMFAQTIVSGLQGPTISPIVVRDTTSHWFSVTVVVHRCLLPQAIAELRSIGGSGIIVSPVTYIFEEEPPVLQGHARRVEIGVLDDKTIRSTNCKKDHPQTHAARRISRHSTCAGWHRGAFRRFTDSRSSCLANSLRCANQWGSCSTKMDTAPRWPRPQTGSRFKRFNSIRIGLHFPRPTQSARTSRGACEAFHRHQPLTSWFTNELGGTLGQIIRPIERAGLYVPGEPRRCHPRVLMSAIPRVWQA